MPYIFQAEHEPSPFLWIFTSIFEITIRSNIMEVKLLSGGVVLDGLIPNVYGIFSQVILTVGMQPLLVLAKD